MFIKNVNLRNFRNFENIQTDFSNQLNFFLGKNGQGKTNLLESLYLLIKGNSFRYSNNESFINHNINESNCQIFSDFTEGELDYKIQLTIEKKSKTLLINKKKTSANQMKKSFFCILFSPESLSFVKESSEFRRELIDDFLISINSKNVDIIYDFKKALRTRNKILKDNKEGKLDEKTFRLMLEAINNLYFKKASELTYERVKGIQEIQSDLNDHMRYISNNNVDIFVDYVASGESFLNFSLAEIENRLRDRYKDLSVAELATGNSLIGPHKHEIIFLYNQKDSRFFCSQGQQRAIILSFKMAQIVYHRKTHGWYPVLMLDDVLSELDLEKKQRLISFLERINTQIFITATDLDREASIKSSSHRIFNISQGKVLE